MEDEGFSFTFTGQREGDGDMDLTKPVEFAETVPGTKKLASVVDRSRLWTKYAHRGLQLLSLAGTKGVEFVHAHHQRNVDAVFKDYRDKADARNKSRKVSLDSDGDV